MLGPVDLDTLRRRRSRTQHAAIQRLDAARSTQCRLTTGPRREGGRRDPQRPKEQRSPPDQGESSRLELIPHDVIPELIP